MAMDEQDHFASIIDDCRCSSSQEEVFVHSMFAREDGTQTFDCGKSPEVVDSGECHVAVNDSDVGKERDSGEFVAVCADCECEAERKLGFCGTRKRGLGGEVSGGEKLDAGLGKICSKEGELVGKESSLKKSKVSGLDSPKLKGEGVCVSVNPLVHCSEKVVIGGESVGSDTLVVRSDLKVEVVSPLNCVALESDQCTEKLGSEDGNDEQVGVFLENAAKKKLKFEDEEGNGTMNGKVDVVGKEVVDENTEGNVSKDDVDGKSSKEDNNQVDGSSHAIKKQGKRELPRSLREQVWGTTVEDCDRARSEMLESGYPTDSLDQAESNYGNSEVDEKLKDGLNEVKSDDGKSTIDATVKDGLNKSDDEKSKGDETVIDGLNKAKSDEGKSKEDKTVKHIFDVLRIFAIEMRDADGVETDIFETAKRNGMTFPQSRFRL